MAEADHEVLEIAEMVIDLSREDASVAECTIERLGLLGAGLIPQAGADQDQEREHGRATNPSSCARIPSDFGTTIAPIDHVYGRQARCCRSKPAASHDTASL